MGDRDAKPLLVPVTEGLWVARSEEDATYAQDTCHKLLLSLQAVFGVTVAQLFFLLPSTSSFSTLSHLGERHNGRNAGKIKPLETHGIRGNEL